MAFELFNIPQNYIEANNPIADAFGRMRVSAPETLFDSAQDYSNQPLFWETITSGSGSLTYVNATASNSLSVTTASGDLAARQSRRHIPYQPGKSQRGLFTFVMNPAQTNLRQRVGIFDGKNGLFLELADDTLYVVQRSNTSGSTVDTRVDQSSWNMDKLDGTGRSGLTLDITKAQILWIDLEWLGVGNPRFGFVIDRGLHYVHEFKNANNLDKVYMRTARLPVRYEIENTGTTSASSTLSQICSEVVSEGGRQDQRLNFTASNGITPRTVSTTPLPVLSLQVDTDYPSGGTVENRLSYYPLEASIFSADQTVHYALIYNGTISGGTWTAVDSNYSGMNYNVGGTSISGGIKLMEGYIPASSTGSNSDPNMGLNAVSTDLFMTLNVTGDVGDTLSLVCTRVDASDASVACTLKWAEF